MFFNFFFRLQEADGGFFENLGTLLAEKAKAQVKEVPLPTRDEVESQLEVSEAPAVLGATMGQPTEPLLESDSDKDENEVAENLLIESMGWNVSIIKHVCL